MRHNKVEGRQVGLGGEDIFFLRLSQGRKSSTHVPFSGPPRLVGGKEGVNSDKGTQGPGGGVNEWIEVGSHCC